MVLTSYYGNAWCFTSDVQQKLKVPRKESVPCESALSGFWRPNIENGVVRLYVFKELTAISGTLQVSFDEGCLKEETCTRHMCILKCY